MIKNRFITKYILPVVFGVLGVFVIADAISLFQNFYYHQKRNLTDFLPGAGFLFALIFLWFVMFVLQIVLFQFLYRLKLFIKFASVIVAVSTVLTALSYAFGQPIDTALLYAVGFLIYSILNYFVHRRTTPVDQQ